MDGEFAVTLVDFTNDKLILSTDTFGTKPLFYAVNSAGQFAVSSYASGLVGLGLTDPVQVDANTGIIFKLSTMQITEQFPVHEFDLRQHKTTFDDWIVAFERSVWKRTQSNHTPFVGVSSGYDSGAIACVLAANNIPHHLYSIVGNEHMGIVKSRHEYAKQRSNVLSSTIIDMDEASFSQVSAFCCTRVHECGWLVSHCALVLHHLKAQADLKSRAEEYTYKSYGNSGQPMDMRNDQGAVGLSKICTLAKQVSASPLRVRAPWAAFNLFVCAHCPLCQGHSQIYLSGHGADEIISDYGWNGQKLTAHSSFGGTYYKPRFSCLCPLSVCPAQACFPKICRTYFLGTPFSRELSVPTS
jgi:hypothetical protein